MNKNKNICGLILCGGKSKRMGTDKGFVKYNNKPLIEHSIDTLSPFFQNIILSSNTKRYKKYNFPVVYDKVKQIGPAGGIFSVMKKTNFEKYFVLAVDLPFVDKNFVEILLKNISTSFEIVVPVHNNNKEPLCAIYSRKILPRLEIQINNKDYKLQNLFKNSTTSYIEANEKLFVNINTIEDINNINA